MDNENIIKRVKSSFCNLTKFKERGNSLEVITAYTTINDKFVSVFITRTNGKIVITDNGWIDQNYYETTFFEDSENLISRIKTFFINSFGIKSTFDKQGVEYFYKTCDNVEQIPSSVFDLANFAVGVINANCIQFKDEKEERERETFRRDANNFLKSNYAESVKLRQPLDDFQSIKFNAIIVKNTDLYLLTYVTGSTQTYFENDLRKSIVNFEIAQKSKLRDNIREKITIVNDKSDGYLPDKSSFILELLKEKATRDPIKWTERERVLEII
jgi:hypothetical protein